jgi:circadian clock protein KaiC
VRGLDAILGGGVPEFSLNIIGGPPGAGKTTLAHQIMFALATPERPALFFTVLGESPLKMLRYQQQFSFFDIAKVDKSVRFINLNDDLAQGGFGRVLTRIMAEVAAFAPAIVVVDSFRAAMHEMQTQSKGGISQNEMIQQLGMQLSASQATTFLIGEYGAGCDSHPIMTVADGLLSLEQSVQRNSILRKIQVLKMRGQATIPGVHTFRIGNAGIEVFPSAIIHGDSWATARADQKPRSEVRLAMGVPGLDDMLGGGLPSGYSLLVAGPSGSGKTTLGTTFLAEGVRRGEAGVMVAFEQTPSQSWTRTIDNMVRAGEIGLINTRSQDLSIDEIVQHLTDLIHQMKATRVVIDSLSGFELAVAPSFREDFRESLFRMIAVLSNLGVTVVMLSELEDRYLDLRFSPYGAAFLTDAIIVQRYIEIESRLRRVMAVVKVRGSTHSNEIRQFEISDDEIVMGDPVLGYEGLLSGRPTRVPTSASPDVA